MRTLFRLVRASALGAAAIGAAIGAVTGSARAQSSRTSIAATPAARWIADTSAPGDAFGVYHFRRTLDLPTRPPHFVVHVSADQRYRLLVNGTPVSLGPQRSDLMHWKYETVDLAPHLVAGRNVIAATVWNWGRHRPVAQLSRRTAFLLQGDDAVSDVASTGRVGWRVTRDPAYAPIPVTGPAAGGYYASPPGERVDLRAVPWGWERADFDDARWRPAGSLELAQRRGTDEYGVVSTWQLAPRSIPPMESRVTRFARVRRATGASTGDRFLRAAGDLVVPARTRATLLLDHGHLTTAYLALDASGGREGTMAMTYAEALVDARGQKGQRDEVDGRTIVGVRDSVVFDGGAHRAVRTLWFRAFRFVQLDIETRDEPLVLHDVHGEYTAYPYEQRGRFASDQAWIDSVWTMSWNTVRACANETFFDTPYYEQLQYVGDTRVQSLIALYVAGDDRLVRNALVQYDASRTSDGLTASRYPADPVQYIPPFSLLWVAMAHDYWMLRDDAAFVRRLIPGTRAVLGWFAERVDATGLVSGAPWWGFVDWTPAWDRGAPPGAELQGHSTAVTLQYVYALDRAAQLEDALGAREIAAGYRTQAARLRLAVRARAWDARRGLFRDAPDSALYSQQTNVLAILTNAVPAAEKRALMERVLTDTTLVQASYYFGFYVLEALREAGLGERYVERLAPWRAMVAMGFTTTPENPEPTRSDSHAWSAHPLHGLLATVLGVRPAAAGFRTVRIAPHLGSLGRAEGRVTHPRGDLDVRLARVGARGLEATIVLPAGVTGTFVWNGRTRPLRAGSQTLRL